MNYSILSRYLGLLFCCIGLFMLPAVLCAVLFDEWNAFVSFLYSFAISILLGVTLYVGGRHHSKRFYVREALALVGLGWVVTSTLGGLPFWLSGMLSHPVDAWFESVSGFTTTGASVMSDIEGQNRSLLFWRSFTHWLGGMGIIVLFISLLPHVGKGGKQLFKSESTGPDPHGMTPRIRDTATILWKLYVGFTLVLVLALWLCGMSLFDSLCHTFGTVATGGFSTYNRSIGHFSSVVIEQVILLFMMLSGVSYLLYFSIISKKWNPLKRDPEWRVYLSLLGGATVLVALDLLFRGNVNTLSQAFRDASFTVVSIMTTTGYVTADFDQWPHFSKAILLILMIVGACAGSTGGGVKVIRFIVLWKIVISQIQKAYAPQSISLIRIRHEALNADVQHTILVFVIIHVFLIVAGTLFMSFLGLAPVTAFSSVIATLNNIGPGFAMVGPYVNYDAIPMVGKGFLGILMILGRIELFSILVLFVPAFWRRH